MENDAENSVEVVLGKSETNGNAALLKYAYTNDGDGANYFAITHYGNTSDTYKFYNTHAELKHYVHIKLLQIIIHGVKHVMEVMEIKNV